MADLSITTTAVKGLNMVKERGIAGEAITQGQPVYRSSTTNKYMKADADSATVEARTARGIALNSASDDQPLTIGMSGDLTINAVLTANTPYYLSGTAGGICPIGDVGTGEYLCQLGIAKSTTVLAVNIQATGVAN